MQTVTFAGNNYSIPTVRGDTPWTGLSDLAVVLAGKAISTAGGAYTLTADLNFGATFGLVSTYFKSRSTNPASAGSVRLASTDTVKWRNNANGADIALDKDTSDNLRWNAAKLLLSGAVVDADINTSAAIALTKLAALNASIVPVTNASGFLSSSATTATELGYVHGVTSALQTQIDAKAADSAVVHNTGTEAVAGAKTFTTQLIGKGTGTNDSAAAGYIGEVISSTAGPTNAATSDQYMDLTSIVLTAGDWAVNLVCLADAAGSTWSRVIVGITSTPGNSSTGQVNGVNRWLGQWANTSTARLLESPTISNYRISLSGTTTYYFKALATYSAGTPQFTGTLMARRVR